MQIRIVDDRGMVLANCDWPTTPTFGDVIEIGGLCYTVNKTTWHVQLNSVSVHVKP